MLIVCRRLVKNVNDEHIGTLEVGDRNVVDNVLALAKHGQTEYRNAALGILCISCSNNEVNAKLRKSHYDEARQEQVVRNKQKAATRPKKRKRETVSTCEQNGQLQPTPSTSPTTSPLPDSNVDALRQFKSINNNTFTKARALMKEVLLQGKSPPPRPSTTKISPVVLLQAIQWITSTFQYRPGKLRNYRLNGTLLKNMPVYIRDGKSHEAIYKNYYKNYEAAILVKQQSKPLGQNTFSTLLKVLTEPPSANAGLSYYYVDFIDLVSELKTMLDSIEDRLNEQDLENCKLALDTARTDIAFGAEYLKYKMKNNLKESSTNIYECCTFAVGGKCDHEHISSASCPLARTLSVHTSISSLADAVVNSNLSPEEKTSIANIAKLTEYEFLHYCKHLCRDWWQHNQISAIKNNLEANEAVLIIDHKQKVLPKRQNESMTEYYGKSGMSLCGAMLITKDADDFEHRFFDVVMDNVSTQRADDVIPVLEVVLREIKKEYNISRVSLVSDNAGAFSSYSHIPFLYACNNVDGFPTIVRWDYTEPQCGKSMLDTHFSYINLQLRHALLDGVGYTNPGELFKALTHDGGIRGTTVLLVKKLDAIVSHHESWTSHTSDKVFKKLGVRSCASIVFKQSEVTLHHASGLEPKATVSTKKWPQEYDPSSQPLGEVVRRMISADSRPLRARPKKKQAEDSQQNSVKTLPVVIKEAVDQHMLAYELPGHATTQTVSPLATTADNPQLKKHWAVKTHRTWLKIDDTVKEKLEGFYMQGVNDPKNKVSAEVAARMLKEDDLLLLWDQRFICSATRIKQFYSTVVSKMKTRKAKLEKAKKQKGGPSPHDSSSDNTISQESQLENDETGQSTDAQLESNGENENESTDYIQDVLEARDNLIGDNVVDVNI